MLTFVDITPLTRSQLRQAQAAFRADPDLKGAHLVALTGYGRDEDERRALQAGFELHLRKPADINTLRRALAGLNESDQESRAQLTCARARSAHRR